MRVLITGGAGFVGTNLADFLASEGHEVTVLDNLSRKGVTENAKWLRSRHPRLEIIEADVRDRAALVAACRGAEQIYHLAAQVAVTTSVADPRTDYEINLGGTINALEAAREHSPEALFFYTSTNKVYGGMDDVKIIRRRERHEYLELLEGVGEARCLDFHSPYGCSKGGADQYVRDYARIYGLRTVVFRMSCIYGPHQCGNEDQGWVAHFVRSALEGVPLTIYGDGRQVRDALYVADLIRAFQLAGQQIERTAGQVYNIGGGPANTTSLLELIALLGELTGRAIPVSYRDWRPGDQLVYVSNTARAREEFGWEPEVGFERGVRQLYRWMLEEGQLKNGSQRPRNRRRGLRRIESRAAAEGVASGLASDLAG